MNTSKMIRQFFTMLFLAFCATILALTLRGVPGNPIGSNLDSSYWAETGPLESSNERSRFSLMYSYVEDSTFYFSIPLAKFSAPDLAITDTGRYVSLFAPGVSFLMMPGYIIGRYFGMAQIGSFAVILLFAFLNIILIWRIAVRLGASSVAAAIGAFVFSFATPAFAYGVTLSQHHISTFIILLGIYALLKWDNYWSLALVWFLTVFSITVDNPNIFFMLPIALYALGRIVIFRNEKDGFRIKIKLLGFLSFLIIILPLGFFFWYNAAANGSPFQLSGTLERVVKVEERNDIVLIKADNMAEKNKETILKEEKNAVGFFSTRNLTNGFYVHFFSPDRGIINFTPVILFGIFGIVLLYKRNPGFANILTGVIGFNVLLYSMWGDPYGGWAFGSRYLIPSYALLAIGIGIFLTQWRRNTAVIIVFFAVFAYSAGVNTLGALAGNGNPPKTEISALKKITGRMEKYSYDRNWQYLREKGPRSFVFKFYAKKTMSAEDYYWLICGAIIMVAAFLLLVLRSENFNFGKVFKKIKIK